MIRFLGLIALVLLSTLSWGQNKDTALVSITNYKLYPGETFSWRGTGTYYSGMAGFAMSSTYTQGHMKQGSQFRMNYRLLFPKTHNPSLEPGYPLIVMLHGAGERGNCWNTCYCEGCDPNDPSSGTAQNQYLNNDHNLLHGGKQHYEAGWERSPNHSKAFPGFVVFPQMQNQWRNSSSPAASEVSHAIRLIRLLCKEYNIDQDRIYIHGLSMGGQAVLEALNFADWLFAGAATMSAISLDGALEYDSIANIPVWFFQGGKDTAPKPSHTATMVRKLREKGGNVRHTVYAHLSHGTWNDAYKEDDFFSWFLSQRKSNIHVAYNNPNICPTTGAAPKLEVAAGFLAYQWERDGAIIPGANQNSYMAAIPGSYRVRFSRISSTPSEAEWNRWSDPVSVGEKSPEAPIVEQIGTTILSDLNKSNKVYLKAPADFVEYTWLHNGGTPISEFVQGTEDPTVFTYQGGCTGGGNCVHSGAYTLVTTGYDQCPSLPSKPKYIIWGTHNTATVPPVITAPPSNFSRVVHSPTSVLLTWNDQSPDERGFEIWRRKLLNIENENFESGWVMATLTEEDVTSFYDTGLDPNSTYWYKIRGVNNIGRSRYTPNNNPANVNHNLVVITPSESEIPTPPGNLIAKTIAVNTVELTWDPSTDNGAIKQYIIYYNGNSISTNAPVTSYVIENLSSNTAFSFTVRAEDTGGNLSLPSNPSVAHTYVEGLYYKHSTGAWNDLDSSSLVATWSSPEYTGWVSNFTLQPRAQEDYFNFEFSGYIYINTGGAYQFSTTSDDGSRLILNDAIIVDNDGPQAATRVESSSQILSAGQQKIVVQYFESTGSQSLVVQYKGPDTGGSWINIPTSALKSGTPPPPPIPPVAPTNLVATASGMQQIDLAWDDNFRVVVVGSSTAVGTGSTPIETNSFVNLLKAWIKTETDLDTLVNLAVGGYDSYDVLPANNPNNNITKALSFNPDIIIVSLPSNDVANDIPLSTTMANLQTLRTLANAQGVRIFFTTSQPRNSGVDGSIGRALLQQTAVEIRNAFGNYVIDVYDELTDFNNDLQIKAMYHSGDNVHLNNAGHQYIFEVARDVLAPHLPSYEVQRGVNTDGPFNTVTITTDISFDNTGLNPNTTYHYRVRTLSADSVSAFTALATATTLGDVVAPSQPTGLISTKQSFSTITLNWNVSTDNVGVTGYEIYVDNVLTATSVINTYQVTGLEANTAYDFYVIAYDVAGNKSLPSATLQESTTTGTTFHTIAGGTTLNSLSSWRNDANVAPTSFGNNGQIFEVQHSLPVGASPWNVEGTVSKVVVDDGVSITVSTTPINATVEIPGTGSITLSHATVPEFGYLSPNSTVNYSGTKFVQATTYGNLGLTGSGAYTFPAGLTTVAGNLTANNGVSIKGASSNETTLQLGGNLTVNGTPAPLASSFGVDLVLTSNGTQTITTGGALDLFRISKTGNGTINLVSSGTPVMLNLGSTVGGGLSLPVQTELNIGNNTLNLVGAATINGAGEDGVIGVNGGSINLTSSSSSGSNMNFNPAANTMSRLTVNLSGSGYANFYSAAKITDALKVTRGTLNPNGHITLVSTASHTANIERIENNGQIISNVKVQRYIDGKGRNYRYISSSVAGVRVADWQNYFPITGAFTGASTGPGLSANPSLFYYGVSDYVAFPSPAGNNQQTIQRGVGYSLFNRHSINATIVETSGIPFQGTIPFVINPNESASSSAGWNLVGNPYASTIAWSSDNTAWPQSGMNQTVSVRNNNGAVTTVLYYDAATGTGTLQGGKIAPGQAFWVQSIAAGASLSITEAAKSTEQQTHYREGTNMISKLRINVSQGTKSDPAFIALTSIGSDKFDPQFDAIKQANTGIFNFSTLSGDDNVALAINNSSDAFCSKTIKLNLRDVTPGNYTLSTENPETLFGVGTIMLVDHFTNTTVDLRNTTAYSFDVTDDVKSFGPGRFEMVMHRPELDLSLQHTSAQVCGEAAPVTLQSTQAGALYSIVNEKGESLSEVLTAAGDALTLTVPKDMLRDGKNTFKVQAQFKGCTAAMLQSPVVVEYIEPPIANVAEFVSVCAGAPAVINVQHPDPAVSYKWYNGNQQPIAGVSSNAFTTGAITMDTTYYVAAVLGKGCEGPKQMVIVTPEILETPAVIPAGDTLYASASQGVQWFKNGESIFNATQPYYVPSTTGSYSVQVTKGGCIANSDEYVVNIESMVFPNPTSSANINFKFISDSDGNMKVSIVDLMGKKVHEDVFSAYDLAGGVKISPSTRLNSGVYFLVVERNGFIRKVKFVLNE